MSRRAQVNREALLSLPPAEIRPLLSREVFAATDQNIVVEMHTQVVLFGASYFGIECEWQVWIEQCETLLRKMYWVTVTAHLETEMSGVYSFVWETAHECHEPGNTDTQLRCEWLHDS